MDYHLEVDGKLKGLSLKVDKIIEAGGDITCGENIISTFSISTGNDITINNCKVPFTTYHVSTVSEHNRSRYFTIPMRATNVFIYLFFGNVGSHALYIKECNLYSRRVGSGGNT